MLSSLLDMHLRTDLSLLVGGVVPAPTGRREVTSPVDNLLCSIEFVRTTGRKAGGATRVLPTLDGAEFACTAGGIEGPDAESASFYIAVPDASARAT